MSSFTDSHLPAHEQVSAAPVTVPTLIHDLRVVVDVENIVHEAGGTNNDFIWVQFAGGRWSASWGHGTLLVCGILISFLFSTQIELP